MPSNSLVSVIIPTRNSAATLDACLKSVAGQTYTPIEIIVVDRDSTDTTKAIAKRFTKHVYNHGPERSAQRNFGAEKSKGEYICIIDSDMELTPEVIQACVQKMQSDVHLAGVIIPEESFGEGFWAKCKALERSFYNGFEPVEAARFMRRISYTELGGYDGSLVAGEDWDLSQRLKKSGKLAHIDYYIRHNEGRIRLIDTMRKKFYYAQHAQEYLRKHPQSAIMSSAGPLARYKLYLSQPRKLLRHPLIGVGMILMKTAEFATMAGFLLAKLRGNIWHPSNR